MSQKADLICCHDCDLLQQVKHMPEDGAVKCCRCDAVLRRRQRIKPEKSIEHTLALVITAIMLFTIANFFPIISLQIKGHVMSASFFSGVSYLFHNDMKMLSGLVFLTSIGAPLIQLSGLLYILLPLQFNVVPRYAPQVYRYVKLIIPWSMLEVLMLGILVSIVKLSAMATIIPGIALWTFALLIFIMAAILADLDVEILWERVSHEQNKQKLPPIGSDLKLINCQNCHLLCTLSENDHEQVHCPRCKAPLHRRIPNSLSRCAALLLAAMVMYIPANVLPVMVVTSLGKTEGDTIMSGVIYLATSGDWPLALIVFVASILVPSIKLIILSFLLYTVHYKKPWRAQQRTGLYRLTELIGRWSMVDIFVDTLMAALVQIQGLAVIEVGVGAVAFGAVVVLTMLAAMAFDPRLIWDNLGEANERSATG